MSPPDFICSLREHNARALDQLLSKRFVGKVGRGLALEYSRRRAHSRRLDSLIESRLEERLDHNTFMRVMEVSALGDQPGGRR